MLGFFKKKSNPITKGNSEVLFWDWFTNNRTKIEKFIDSDHGDLTTYDALTNKIKSYNPVLFPELTKTTDDKYVLIITPDGLSEGIESTKKLGESHPEISGWVIQKFRQPCDEVNLNFNGLKYPASDIEILPETDHEKEKIHIRVFIRNMNSDEAKYKSLAFLYLDHILGEFNTITKIGYIDFLHLDPGKQVKDSISILQLRKLIEQELYLKSPGPEKN